MKENLIGSQIICFRKQAGITQEELGRAAGVSTQAAAPNADYARASSPSSASGAEEGAGTRSGADTDAAAGTLAAAAADAAATWDVKATNSSISAYDAASDKLLFPDGTPGKAVRCVSATGL